MKTKASASLPQAIAALSVYSLLLSVPLYSANASSKQAQAAGAAVFHDRGCQHCHGVDLTGTDRGPDLSTVGKKWHKDRIAGQIREGGGGMPPFGDVLQPDEITSLVDFLSAKRKPARKGAVPAPVKPPAAAKPSSGDSGNERLLLSAISSNYRK